MTEPNWVWPARDQRLFLESLLATGDPGDAAATVGRSIETAYRMRERAPEFAAAWLRVLGIAWEQVEMRVLASLLHGKPETIDAKLALAVLQRRPPATRGTAGIDPARVSQLRGEIRALATPIG